MDKAHILAELRRTASANGGAPLGKARFEAETGIRESDWSGRHWARWSDAVREAGLEPNAMQTGYAEEFVLSKLVDEIRRLQRMPTSRDLGLRRRQDNTFPSPKVFERLGPKADLVQKVADYCRDHTEHADVLEMLPPPTVDRFPGDPNESVQYGFVYMLKSGRHYKIGHTFDVGRRRYELAIQLPERAAPVHEIRTDDPVGIERYWHARFATRRKNGEWFELAQGDVKAFKRRKFM